MPMGTGPDDTGHLPAGPSGGSLLSESEKAAKIAELRRQLAEAENDTAPAFAQTQDTTAASPAAPTQQTVFESPTPAPGDAPTVSPPADPKPAAPEGPFSHWLHLADGRVVKSLGTVTHWFEEGADHAIPVVAAIVNPSYKPGEGDKNARVRAVLAELAALTGIDLSHIANQL